MARSKIKTAVLGLGENGLKQARFLTQQTQLVGVAEVNAALGLAVAKELNTEFFPADEVLINNEQLKPELVVVAVPSRQQYQTAETVIAAGRSLFLNLSGRKTAGQIQDLLNLAQKNKVYLQLRQTALFNPAVIKLNKLIDSGRLGEVLSIYGLQTGLANQNNDEELVYGWLIEQIDLLKFLLHDSPSELKLKKIKLNHDHEQQTRTVALQYGRRQKMTAQIHFDWQATTQPPQKQLLIRGSKADVQLDLEKQLLLLYPHQSTTANDDWAVALSLLNQQPQKVYINRREALGVELRQALQYRQQYHRSKAAQGLIETMQMMEKLW